MSTTGLGGEHAGIRNGQNRKSWDGVIVNPNGRTSSNASMTMERVRISPRRCFQGNWGFRLWKSSWVQCKQSWRCWKGEKVDCLAKLCWCIGFHYSYKFDWAGNSWKPETKVVYGHTGVHANSSHGGAHCVHQIVRAVLDVRYGNIWTECGDNSLCGDSTD